MSVRRALVSCVVLSVQDACVFYPCCEGCFSRVDVDQRDTTRCRCSRCGYSCLREQVDYRYRLSLTVTRESCIFGVTVFGTCLNPFFGIPASGLQRLVENVDGQVGASTRASLLAKAVKDCFIGRHFIFGIKVTGTESGLCFGGPGLSKDGDRIQFIASQMILPKAAGLGGCTVVSYYRTLLQKAAENELGSKTSRPLETTRLLIRHLSPFSSFNNSILSTPGLLSLSLQRSQHQDSTLSPTPPWQQSLGLVTSSAEQEEGFGTQDYRGNENSCQETKHHLQRVCLDKHKVTEERALSPLISSEHRSDFTQSFANCPNRSFEKAVETTPLINSWFSTSPPGHTRDLPLSCKTKGFSTRQLLKTFSSSSVAWEDLPFSESLTDFLCEEHKDFDIVSGTEPHLNVQNQSETVRNNLEIRSQDKNLSIESTSVCQSSTQIAESHSWMLHDITNTTNNVGDRHDLSDLVCKDYTDVVNKSQARSICFHRCNDEGEVSFENQEEQLEGEAYDCSVDLFGCSLMMDTNIKSPNTHSESVRRTTEPCALLLKQHLRSDINVTHTTPDKQKLRSMKSRNRDSFVPQGTQDLDFIPPAQSTPIVKVDVSASPLSSSFSSTLGEFSAQPYSQFTPKRRFWKPNKPKKLLQAQQPLRVQSGRLRLQTPERINRKRDSSVCDVTEDSEVFVPPTPAAKGRLSVKLRRRKRQTGNSSNTLVSTWKAQQGDGVDDKRNLLEHHLSSLTSSQKELAQTGNCGGGGEAGDVRSLDSSNGFLPDDENQACDWSRDLFSDSA
ncbi:DNA damage-induced apoptosis suppressor protein isoform X1 [Paralichthys olivaceus]|uniref:DNA damage-induced apoptosis suppressor protein isoform X1 n=1 Tax=Paralichthys olivaceus TaxID=8255 RepID=UPI0037537910